MPSWKRSKDFVRSTLLWEQGLPARRWHIQHRCVRQIAIAGKPCSHRYLSLSHISFRPNLFTFPTAQSEQAFLHSRS
ncbi:hypothetical protein C1C98_31240 [Pseudomonas ogarae]|uniref:Uncharacterized protein n=1 Tax=Pseudomonas ogarae (strain DSM 112162 / CECT 30235 / F113) TaxID=1114970 RepID=A0ABM6R7Z4_PSEO1|nr:hypothetical protein C1C98_31240 [Pseudomonas ogarae]